MKEPTDAELAAFDAELAAQLAKDDEDAEAGAPAETEEAVPTFVEENRIGEFRIDDRIIAEDPTRLLQIFAHTLVIRAEHRFELRATRYIAYSPLFQPSPLNSLAPQYDFIFSDDGSVTLETRFASFPSRSRR